MRTLTYYVAVTMDGFIAGPNGEYDFFPIPDELTAALVQEYPETVPTHVRDHLGIDSPNKKFDSVVMGRRTWEPSLDAGVTSAYKHLDQYVFSTTMTEAPDDTVTLVDSDPLAYVRDLKKQDGAGIWLCGGGSLAGTLLPEIDELVLKISPVVIGDGIPLFRSGFDPIRFDLTESRVFGGVTVNRLVPRGAAA